MWKVTAMAAAIWDEDGENQVPEGNKFMCLLAGIASGNCAADGVKSFTNWSSKRSPRPDLTIIGDMWEHNTAR